MKHSKDRKNTKIIYLIILIFISIMIIYLINFFKTEKTTEQNQIAKVGTIEANKIETVETNSENKKTDEEPTKEKDTEEIKNSEEKKEEVIISTYKGYPVIAKLEIPKINLVTDVLSEYSEKALQISVTKFYGGLPNEEGNFCISGHNYINSNMFRNLKNLEINDEIYLTDGNYGKVKYIVYDILTVTPDQTQCLSQKTNGKVELTLITCTTDSKKRIIIKARKGNM